MVQYIWKYFKYMDSYIKTYIKYSTINGIIYTNIHVCSIYKKNINQFFYFYYISYKRFEYWVNSCHWKKVFIDNNLQKKKKKTKKKRKKKYLTKFSK